MSSAYVPNPATPHATIQVPDDGDGVNVASVNTGIKALADLVANALLNEARTNADNNFSVLQTLLALHVTGGATFDGLASLNGGRAQATPNPFTATRVLVDIFGNASNGKPFIRAYVSGTNSFEIVINGAWNEGTGAWDRDFASNSFDTIKYVFSPDGLFALYFHGTAASVDDGSGWTKTLDLRWPFSSGSVHPAGGVLGLATDNDISFGTAPLSSYFSTAFPTAFASSFATATNPNVQTVGPSDFASGWSNTGGGARAAKYWKDPSGVVHVEGAVSGSSGGTVFNLPAGYRPSGTVGFALLANGTFDEVKATVSSGGDVVLSSNGTYAGLYLDGISFRAEA